MLFFVFSVLGLVGMGELSYYLGFGLADLPFFLLKSKKSLSSAHEDVYF